MKRDFAALLRRCNVPGICFWGERAVKNRHGGRPSEAEISEINAKHLVNTPLRPADLLFVFGTREDASLRAATACRLWREGMYGWSIVSGGVTAGSDLSECTIIKTEMVTGGVPAD